MLSRIFVSSLLFALVLSTPLPLPSDVQAASDGDVGSWLVGDGLAVPRGGDVAIDTWRHKASPAETETDSIKVPRGGNTWFAEPGTHSPAENAPRGGDVSSDTWRDKSSPAENARRGGNTWFAEPGTHSPTENAPRGGDTWLAEPEKNLPAVNEIDQRGGNTWLTEPELALPAAKGDGLTERGRLN